MSVTWTRNFSTWDDNQSGGSTLIETSILFAALVAGPSIGQSALTSGAANDLTVSAQSSLSGPGGDLMLQGGDGTTDGGNVILRGGDGANSDQDGYVELLSGSHSTFKAYEASDPRTIIEIGRTGIASQLRMGPLYADAANQGRGVVYAAMNYIVGLTQGGADDLVFNVGINNTGEGGKINTAEPAIYLQFEWNYDVNSDGEDADNGSEWHIEYRHATDGDLDRRPLTGFVNHTTGNCESGFAGLVTFANHDRTTEYTRIEQGIISSTSYFKLLTNNHAALVVTDSDTDVWTAIAHTAGNKLKINFEEGAAGLDGEINFGTLGRIKGKIGSGTRTMVEITSGYFILGDTNNDWNGLYIRNGATGGDGIVLEVATDTTFTFKKVSGHGQLTMLSTGTIHGTTAPVLDWGGSALVIGSPSWSAGVYLDGPLHIRPDAGTDKITVTTTGIGLYAATPVAQHSSTGQTSGFTQGSGTEARDDSTFTGGVGSKAYTIGDVVRALKNLGAMATS